MLGLQVPATIGLADAVGIGIDVADVAEFAVLPYEHHTAFYRRCFSADEIAYSLSQAAPEQHFAVRFAAKEAAVKAFSSITRLAYWQIEVVRSIAGSPALRFWDEDRSGPALELEPFRALVSLSHTDSLATAFVVVYDRRT